jgi:hypothetical protein
LKTQMLCAFPLDGEGWACPERSRRDGGDVMILYCSKFY